MIDDTWEDEDEKPEPVTDAESQELADQRAREAKYGEPKLTKGGELPDDFPRIKSGVIKAAKIGLCIVPLAIVGVVYASKTAKPPVHERDVLRPGKAAEPASELAGLADAQKRMKAEETPKLGDAYDAVDPNDPAFTTPVTTVKPGYDEDNCPAEYSANDCVRLEMKRLKVEGDAPLPGQSDSPERRRYLANRSRDKFDREDPGDESFTETAPPPMSVDWGKKAGRYSPGPAPMSVPSVTAHAPQLPPGLGEALAKAAGQQNGPKDHGDGDDVKEAFASRSGESLDSDAIERDLGECELTAGTPISATNIMALNTDVPAKAAIKVAITQTVYCGGQRQHIAFPPGSEFTASANARVTYGDNRIQVCMNQLRRPPSAGLPNGTVLPITGCWVAAELDGTPGWAADVDNHWSQLIAGVALSTFLSLGTTAAAGSQEGFAPTIAQGAARQAGAQMNQAGQRIVQRDLMRKPTLTRDMLQHALVIVTQNQPLTPWVPEKSARLRRW